MSDSRPILQRVMDKTVKLSCGCWPFLGWHTPTGHGQVSDMGKNSRRRRYAHNVVYEALVGPIPAGMVLDHLCRVPCCVNPMHLEPVNHRENVLRGIGPTAVNAQKTHCVHGHPLSGDNLQIRSDGGRRCRTCRAIVLARYNARLATQKVDIREKRNA